MAKETANLRLRIKPSIHRKLSKFASKLAVEMGVSRVTLGDAIDYLISKK